MEILKRKADTCNLLIYLKEFNLNRQDYCGLVCLKMEREEKKMLG